MKDEDITFDGITIFTEKGARITFFHGERNTSLSPSHPTMYANTKADTELEEALKELQKDLNR